MDNPHCDVLIIGAGLSGIGNACHITRHCPGKRVLILERRRALGGTWDLFRYPGVRSDSDMFSYAFDFRPWQDTRVLAEGAAIRRYLTETVADHGLAGRIRYGLKVVSADWSSEQRLWRVMAEEEGSGHLQQYTCAFLLGCTGYYDYDRAYRPHFPGEEQFRGQFVHPQHWREDLDVRDKRVVVIGSGATAVTLVPALAGTAAHVTMLQRSPSYIYSMPAEDRLTATLARLLPASWAYRLARRRNILIQRALYLACRRWPERMRGFLLRHAREQLGPDVDLRHFSPDYMPWDERLCAVPDGDLFRALREGRASVETDTIDHITERGIQLSSGKTLEADIIVTATGLELQMLGGMVLRVDGQPRHLGQLMTYRGVLVESLPNLGWIFGYTNASWTLKADIAARYFCRLFDYMEAQGFEVVTPVDREHSALAGSILDSLQSGYIERSAGCLPRQGRALPWRIQMHYGRDRRLLLHEPVADPCLEFLPRQQAQGVSTAAAVLAP
jgi:monooxygenase